MNEIKNSETEQQVAPPQEPKVMQQHEITALLTGEKKKAYEKGRNEARAELLAEIQANSAQTLAQNQGNSIPSNGTVGAPIDNESRLRQIALEELTKQRAVQEEAFLKQQAEENGMRILGELTSKANAAKTKIDDYEKVVGNGFANLANTPLVLTGANHFDNAGEMMYELAKKPMQRANLEMMLEKGIHNVAFRNDAYLELKRLSDSLKVNEMSANQPKPKEPLSQINPSNLGVGKIDDISSSNFRGSY